MLNIVKGFFSKISSDQSNGTVQNTAHDVRVAACALFVEMGRIDETFTPAEMEFVLGIIKEKYGLSPTHADALLADAERELSQSVDLWQFAKLINANYSIEEKLEIIEILWEIVFVDGKMDKYENYLMHKLSDLLRLSHRQLIEAKLNVKNL